MKIEFYPSSKDVELLVPPPKPAAHYIPKWYRDVPKFSDKNIEFDEGGGVKGLNIKSCVPFLDAMLNGYIQETWQDVAINISDDGVQISNLSEPTIVSMREKTNAPVGNGYYPAEFIWKVPWIPKVPKGWSVMYVTPLNHLELPFVTGTGIQDSDNFYHGPFGNYPFYIKKGFSGIIPKGTPMFQIVPIRRESWESSTLPWDEEDQKRRSSILNTKFYGVYKSIFHVKKEFK